MDKVQKRNRSQPIVEIVIGSEKDYDVMKESSRILGEFGVPCNIQVISAHRTPEKCRVFAKGAEKRGVKVIIAGAGKSAHLAGVIASWTTLPVIGVPLDSGMGGLDALLSTVQMPAGVPVACMAIGRSGAVNAALFAMEILALQDPNVREKLKEYRKNLGKNSGKKESQ